MFSGFWKSEFQPLHITSHYTSLLGRVVDSAHADPAQRGAAPGGAPASPLGCASPPLPPSCHAFGGAKRRASPFSSQPLSCLQLHSVAGVPSPSDRPTHVGADKLPSLKNLVARNAGPGAPVPSFRKPHPHRPQSPSRSVSPASHDRAAAPRLLCEASGSGRQPKKVCHSLWSLLPLGSLASRPPDPLPKNPEQRDGKTTNAERAEQRDP
jgi:hypothetical protein